MFLVFTGPKAREIYPDPPLLQLQGEDMETLMKKQFKSSRFTENLVPHALGNWSLI